MKMIAAAASGAETAVQKRVPHVYCDGCGAEVSGDEKLIRFKKSSGLDDSWMCKECFNKVIDSLTFTVKVSTLLSSL